MVGTGRPEKKALGVHELACRAGLQELGNFPKAGLVAWETWVVCMNILDEFGILTYGNFRSFSFRVPTNCYTLRVYTVRESSEMSRLLGPLLPERVSE